MKPPLPVSVSCAAMQARSKRCCKQRCDPCPPVLETAHRASSYQPHLLSTMSGLLDKARQKVKKKADRLMDRFRPSPRESRAASPAPSPSSQPTEHSATPAPETEPQPSIPVAFSAMTQTMMTPTSVPSQLPSPTAADASSLSLETDPLDVPDYARPPSPTKILATTRSVVKQLTVAARDGSDLFLPLKAALVSVVAIWDVFDVCHFTPIRIEAYTSRSVLLRPRPNSQSSKANSRRSKPSPTLIWPSPTRSMRAYRLASSC